MTGLKVVTFGPEGVDFLVEAGDDVEAVNKAIAAHWSLAYRYSQYRRRDRALDRRNYVAVGVDNLSDLFYCLSARDRITEVCFAYGVIMLV